MPPANIDMSAIREALARRAAGGGGTPATMQVSNPAGGTPLNPAPQVAAAGPLAMQQAPGMAQQPQAAPQAPQQAQGAQSGQQAGGGQKAPVAVDDQTKAISKALIAKLLQVI